MQLPQNQYPNYTNFQSVSFPQEVTPPDEDPFVNVKCVKYNPAWAEVLMSACSQLTQLSAWAGTDDEKKLAVSRAANLKQQLQDFEDCCCMGCCQPNFTRFTDTGVMQVSDDGTTWTDAPPGTDPRYSGSIAPPIPPVEGEDIKCKAASSATEVLKDQQQQLANDAGAWGGVSEMIAALVALLIFIGIIGSAGALTPLLMAMVGALLFAGQAAFAAAFNDTVWNVVQCAIYCNTPDSAAPYTQANVDAIKAKISSSLTGVAKDFLVKTIDAWGATGLTNASRAGMINDFDCSTCDCVPECSEAHWTFPTGLDTGTDFSMTRDETASTITMHSAGFSGFYYAQIYSTIGSCCHVSLSLDFGTGSPSTLVSQVWECAASMPPDWNNEANAHWVTQPLGNFANVPCKAVEVRANVPFTAVFIIQP